MDRTSGQARWAPGAGPPEVLERLQPEAWQDVVSNLKARFQERTQAGVKGSVAHTDCAEVPCITYIEMEGLAKTIEYSGDPATDERLLLLHARRAYEELVKDELSGLGVGAAPRFEVVSNGTDQATVVLTFLPLSAIPSKPGVRVTPSPQMTKHIRARIASYFR